MPVLTRKLTTPDLRDVVSIIGLACKTPSITLVQRVHRSFCLAGDEVRQSFISTRNVVKASLDFHRDDTEKPVTKQVKVGFDRTKCRTVSGPAAQAADGGESRDGHKLTG